MISYVFSSLFTSHVPLEKETSAHTSQGTAYGQKGVLAYAESNHGPDGRLFLDPYFRPDLDNLNNDTVCDAGCGAGPWSIYAAKQGGRAYGIDLQPEMVEAAQKAARAAQVNVTITQGDVAALPYANDFFDRTISICVGCNLPLPSFNKHVAECNRTAKPGGLVVFGAPTSLNVVFTNGSKSNLQVSQHIQEVLNQLPDNPSSEQIVEALNTLQEVLSATFFIKDGRLTLLSNENDLQEGDPIWRKLPKLVVPNRYYSRGAYIRAFEKNNFKIEREDTPHFGNDEERIAYNNLASQGSELGPEYVSHPPFVIFHIRKNENYWNIASVVKKTTSFVRSKLGLV